MPPKEIGIPERTEEIGWRHVWLKSVLIDAGNPFPTKIYRPRPTRHMSLTPSGKASPHASGPRTAAITDGKLVFLARRKWSF